MISSRDMYELDVGGYRTCHIQGCDFYRKWSKCRYRNDECNIESEPKTMKNFLKTNLLLPTEGKKVENKKKVTESL